MGLAEKRIIKEFETTAYPALKKKIDEAAGFEVVMEVRWDTLAKDEKYQGSWIASWPKIYFVPIENAFKEICADAMGRDALKGALKKIIVQNAAESYSSYWATFDDGVLTLDYQFTNVDAVDDRTQKLRAAVEAKL